MISKALVRKAVITTGAADLLDALVLGVETLAELMIFRAALTQRRHGGKVGLQLAGSLMKPTIFFRHF